MKKILHPKTIVTVIVLAVFVLASSGFTTILHECSLPAEMPCCMQSSGMDDNHCLGTDTGTSGPMLQSDIVCHANVLVGGLQPAPAVQEKQVRADVQKSVVSSASLLQSDPNVAFDNTQSLSYRVSTSPVFSPQDRSILFASLLI